mgnify:CR=1 FL=1
MSLRAVFLFFFCSFSYPSGSDQMEKQEFIYEKVKYNSAFLDIEIPENFKNRNLLQDKKRLNKDKPGI